MTIEQIKSHAEDMGDNGDLGDTRILARMIVDICEELEKMKPLKDRLGSDCARCRKFTLLSKLTLQDGGLVCVDCLSSSFNESYVA